MNCRYLFFIILGLFFVSYSFSQDSDDNECVVSASKKAVKFYKKALSVSFKNPPEANHLLKEALKEDPDYADAHYKLARMAMGRESYLGAKKHLIRVLEICPEYNIYAHYYLGKIYYGSDEYSGAVKHMAEFIKYPDKIKADRHYNTAENILSEATFYGNLYNNPVPFEPENVKGICTDKDEYLPFVTADNELAYFTRRFQKKKLGDLFPTKVEQFTLSKKIGKSFDRGEPMKAPFNRGSNEGGACLTIDNLDMYFTKCKPLTNGYNNCDIYTADYVVVDESSLMDIGFMVSEMGMTEGEVKYEIEQMKKRGDAYMWTNIRPLSDKVNGMSTWESQPTISSDGNTLFFTSNRKGGLGGLDLYQTKIDSAGEWGEPTNLGDVINTSSNEKSPFLHPDKQTLYFSSDGHKGLGGFDIFYSRMDKIKTKESEDDQIVWQVPKNIGYPINSEENDLGFFVSTDGKIGYFSSTNTSEKYRSFGGWDLYSFPLYEDARPEKVLFISGESKSNDGKPLTNVDMEITNTRTKEVTKVKVDPKMGKYAAVVTLDDDDDEFIVNVSKENHAFSSKVISAKEMNSSVEDDKQAVKMDVELEKLKADHPYQINNIQFATNSSSVLTMESMLVLDGFVKYLKKYIELEVAIWGHTDAVGSHQDNISLSEGRAKSVKNYLVLSGISDNRLTYKGFGESKPIATNDTEDGMAKNRRTEFAITAF